MFEWKAANSQRRVSNLDRESERETEVLSKSDVQNRHWMDGLILDVLDGCVTELCEKK